MSTLWQGALIVLYCWEHFFFLQQFEKSLLFVQKISINQVKSQKKTLFTLRGVHKVCWRIQKIRRHVSRWHVHNHLSCIFILFKWRYTHINVFTEQLTLLISMLFLVLIFLWLGCAHDSGSISSDYAVQCIQGHNEPWKGFDWLVLC